MTRSADGDGFNWKRTGPGDVARSGLARLDGWVRGNAVWVLGSIVILTLGVWHYQPSWPGTPPLLKVLLVAAIPATPVGLYVGVRLAYALDTPETELLSIQNPTSGDQELIHVSPERFRQLTVLNHNLDERDRDYLHEVRINGKRAYEVDQYYPEENTAIASWQAGVSNSEMRRQKATIKEVRKELEKEADKAQELLANNPSILRRHASEVAMRLIRATEGIEIPEGEQLHDKLAEELDANDPSDQLLGTGDGVGSDGQSQAQSPSGETIFARADRNGHSEEAAAAAAGGDAGGDDGE